MSKLWIPIILGKIAAVLSIVGLSIPHWASYYHRKIGHAHYGLWRTCSDVGGCRNTESTSAMLAVRLLETLGVILTTLSVVSATLRQCLWPERFRLVVVTAGSVCFIAGLMMLLGDIIFGIDSKSDAFDIVIDNVRIDDYQFQEGFYLSVAAGFIDVFSGILFCAFKVDREEPGVRRSHAVSTVRPEDTGLYKPFLVRETFKSFQPGMPSRYNHRFMV